MQKLLIRACIKYLHYVPIGMTSQTIGLGSLVLTFAAFSALIFLYFFREKVAELDQRLASVFSYVINTEGIHVPNPYDVGLINFINSYPLTYVVFPLCTIIFCIVILFYVVRTRDSSVYLYFPLSFIVYAVTVQTTVIVLKILLRRPRPRNTHEFGLLLETCKYEFQAIFTPYLGRSQCSYSLSSTPSGHTAAASYCVLPSIAYIVQLYELIKAYWTPRPLGLTILTILMGILFVCMTICGTLAIILMIIARLSAGAHFLSDTLTAVLISMALLFVVTVTRPDVHIIQKYDLEQVSDQESIKNKDADPSQ